MVCVKPEFSGTGLVTKIETGPDRQVQCPLSKYTTIIRESKSKYMEEMDSFIVENFSSISH